MWGRANTAKQHLKSLTDSYTAKFIKKDIKGQIRLCMKGHCVIKQVRSNQNLSLACGLQKMIF